MRPLPVSAPPRVLSAAERPPPSRSASPASNATSSRKPSEADARVCLLLGAARMPLSPSLTPAGDSVPAPVEAVGEALLKTEDQAGLSQQEQSGGQGDSESAGPGPAPASDWFHTPSHTDRHILNKLQSLHWRIGGGGQGVVFCLVQSFRRCHRFENFTIKQLSRALWVPRPSPCQHPWCPAAPGAP